MHGHSSGVLLRSVVICLTAFSDGRGPVCDAGDPAHARAGLQRVAGRHGLRCQRQAPWAWRVAGLAVALFAQRIDRRLGILVSLALLSIPTALLAVAPDITHLHRATGLRRGLCMASGFTLMLAYLGEECSAMDAGGAFARLHHRQTSRANLIGRLISAGIADHLGLASNFFISSPSSIWAGAALVYLFGREGPHRCSRSSRRPRSPVRCLARAFAQPASCARAFGIGFLHPVRLPSAPSPTSISYWCVLRCRSGRWSSASSTSCSLRRS